MSELHNRLKKRKISNGVKAGKVYLIGAGPGKPDLITVRGLNILKEADVIVYDYLVNRGILENTKNNAELICCDRLRSFYGKDALKSGKKRGKVLRRCSEKDYIRDKTGKGEHSNVAFLYQEKINNLLVKKVKEGRNVVRLKNGDPSIFSRCSQELSALAKERIEFEIVPGVTAASAASCLTGIPLTDRRFASSCIFVTGYEDPAKEKSAVDYNVLDRAGTVVLYMAVGNLPLIVRRMLEAGKDKSTPVAIVRDVSLATQNVLTGTLKDIVAKAKKQNIKPPAIIIIGKVAKSEERFNWLRKNKRILFTGLSPERFFIKGTYFHLPLIKIKPMENYKEFDNYLRNMSKFDWVVFASRYGVEYFFKRLKNIGVDLRTFSRIKIAAVGNSTKDQLLNFGVLADLVPQKESSKGLLKSFRKVNLKGKKIFLPRSNLSDKGLKEGLQRLGAKVTTAFAYRNVVPKDLPALDLNNFNEIMFTSPSTVRSFKKRYKKVPQNIRIRCIGDVTLKEAKKCRLIG